jgi:hypothetical protein
VRYFARLSPIAGFRDLRQFLAQRERHELVFFFVSIVITTLLISGFVVDSHVEKPYKRDIVYFKSWPENRTLADIKADQVRDMALKTKRDVTLEKRQADLKAQFQKVDDKLTSWGL